MIPPRHAACVESERLTLVPFGEQHLTGRYIAWLNDPEVTRFSRQRHVRHTRESCRAYLDAFAGTSHHFWAVMARDPALGHVGNLTAAIDQPNRLAELSILIGERRIRGQGYGCEAWIAACGFLIGCCGLRKVAAGTRADNEPMLAVMRQSGMVEDGRRRRHFLTDDGHEIDIVHAALFAETWKAATLRAFRQENCLKELPGQRPTDCGPESSR